MKKQSVLLDTSFLISLITPERRNHATAKAYYRHMIESNIQMHFSTVVASEFSIGQPISQLPLSNFITLPFNIIHATESGKLWNCIIREDDDIRHVVRDDLKLISQASREGISFIITEDAKTLYKHCERLRENGMIKVRPIKLVDGFDISFFNHDGQMDITSTLLQEIPDTVQAMNLESDYQVISTTPSALSVISDTENKA